MKSNFGRILALSLGAAIFVLAATAPIQYVFARRYRDDLDLRVTNIQIGSMAEWLAAMGTFAAVAVALHLATKDTNYRSQLENRERLLFQESEVAKIQASLDLEGKTPILRIANNSRLLVTKWHVCAQAWPPYSTTRSLEIPHVTSSEDQGALFQQAKLDLSVSLPLRPNLPRWSLVTNRLRHMNVDPSEIEWITVLLISVPVGPGQTQEVDHFQILNMDVGGPYITSPAE